MKNGSVRITGMDATGKELFNMRITTESNLESNSSSMPMHVSNASLIESEDDEFDEATKAAIRRGSFEDCVVTIDDSEDDASINSALKDS